VKSHALINSSKLNLSLFAKKATMNAGIINIYTKPTDCPIAFNNSKPFPVSKKDLYPINANENTIFIYFEDVRLLFLILKTTMPTYAANNMVVEAIIIIGILIFLISP
tara:strand:+ start:272 stop:595 length:324 start_codon:yes stop_codon:yes gene_type:complete